MKKNRQQKSRQEINDQSRLLKKKRKHKGLASGSRLNEGGKSTANNGSTQKDPRIGSKKTIPLLVEQHQLVKPKSSPTIKELSPAKELEQIENDPYLETLLDLTENKQSLTTKQQQDLNRMLDRIDYLMNLLGYTDNEDIDEGIEDKKEDIMSLLKK